MVKKTDWKTVDMPEETVHFTMKMKLTSDGLENLKNGHRPKEMEDKWFMYFENGQFYIHRSWTGYCIYVISLMMNKDILEVTANRNKEQYAETNIENDKIIVTALLNLWSNQGSDHGELMIRRVKQFTEKAKKLKL